MRIHVFQHVPFEGLGSIASWAEMRKAEVTWTRFCETPSLPVPPFPSLSQIDLLIALGGSMSVNDEVEFPWLIAEKAFIKEAIAAGTPTLGICLGAQLIASALGARVYAGREKEIGWFPVSGRYTPHGGPSTSDLLITDDLLGDRHGVGAAIAGGAIDGATDESRDGGATDGATGGSTDGATGGATDGATVGSADGARGGATDRSEDRGHFAFPAEIEVFHWHGETFDLPPGALRLASTPVTPNQAFRIGERVMGLQFHLETTPESAEVIVAHCGSELVPGERYIQSAEAILAAPPERYKFINALMHEVLEEIVR